MRLRAGWAFACALILLSAGATARGQAAPPPERLANGTIENLYRLSPRLLSGGQPEGDSAFQSLKALGVKTVVSVDGAPTDAATAKRFGMRYVHLPIGYEGIGRDRAVELIQAARSLPGPVYVHCHHGKHRGPAAAAICGMAIEGWDQDRALAWLRAAGTSPDYPGLFEAVRRFTPPTADELRAVDPARLPSRAKTPDLVAAMVAIDRAWDHLKAIREAGFRSPPNQPDIDPAREATLLAEQLREAQRLAESRQRGDDFLRLLGDSERLAAKLAEAIRAESPERETVFLAAGKSCAACHSRHRDR